MKVTRDEVLMVKGGALSLNLKDIQLTDEFYYNNLSSIVLASVFSLNASRQHFMNVVSRYCRYRGNAEFRNVAYIYPTRLQEPLSEFIAFVESVGVDSFARHIVCNLQRTDTHKDGWLKAQAALEFAKVLQKWDAEYLQDIAYIRGTPEFEADIKTIRGQTRGTSLVFFYMLTGDDNHCKPDRMIHRFIETCIQRPVSFSEAQYIIREVAYQLADIEMYQHVTPRLLDFAIWNHQRSIGQAA